MISFAFRITCLLAYAFRVGQAIVAGLDLELSIIYLAVLASLIVVARWKPLPDEWR